MKRFKYLMLSAMMLAGCGNESVDGHSQHVRSYGDASIFKTHQQGLMQANSCEDYREYLLDSAAADIAIDYFNGYRYYDLEEAVPAADPSYNGSSSGSSESAGEFTTTNIQEAGVDEPDIVKNDDKSMYVLKGHTVRILKAWPADQVSQIGEIDLGNDYGQVMFLKDDKLVVISQHYGIWNDSNSFSGTRVGIYDVADPSSPKLLHTHSIEGYYSNARLINGKIYLVLNNWISAYDWNDYDAITKDLPEYDWEALYKLDEAERQKLIEKYTPVIRARLAEKSPSIDSLRFPKYYNGETTRNAVSCNDLYIPKMAGRENGILMVAELSGDTFENYASSAVADGGWTVYASSNNVYIVSSSSNWFWYCWEGDECRNYSQIHRFDLQNGLHYAGTGEVDGYVSDSYWMSEYDGHLRVASDHLTAGWWNSNDGSSLSVLDIRTMQKVGSVSGIAKGEQIYAARMFGPKGYMVTFRNTDPLFTLDLSDPKSPQIKGELKINGYSSYIHPLGDDALLTIGRDGDEDGTIYGVQLQIFDVSDLSAPKPIAQEVITRDNYNNYSDSTALWDTHAFMYHAGSGLLSIPINLYHWSEYNDYNFSGAIIYRATRDNGFERIGMVNHADLLPPDDGSNYYYRWWTQLNRSRFYFAQQGKYDIDAYVYTISDVGVKVSDALHPRTTYSTVKY